MDTRLTRRAVFLLIMDIIATFGAYLIAIVLTDQWSAMFVTNDVLFTVALLAVVNVIVFLCMHLYSGLWEFASYDSMTQVLISVLLSTMIGAVFTYLADVRLPIRVFFVAFFLLLTFVGGLRFVYRYSYMVGKARRERAPLSKRPRTMIIGAGETGGMCIHRMLNGDYAMQGIPIVAVDDDPAKQGMRLHGVKVKGTRHDILKLVRDYDIEQIVVAILVAPPEDRREIFAICAETDCKLLTLPDVKDMRISDIGNISLRKVNLADLLGREEIVLDTKVVSQYISHKTILITGAGGSIGSELVRQIVTVSPRHLILFDIYENGVFDLRGEILEKHPEAKITIEIGSIRDARRMREVFEKHKPEVVFHAAAHKHVPLMEACPREAVKNNVFGTLNTVRMADAYGAERFIFISTDKAVNPANVMGATKRMGEMIIQTYAQISKQTVFTAVRFGNVLGSHGSVIPIFTRQIEAGGPLRVTHPDIVRYFMTIPEAARLVVQAGGMAKGGEIFILNMGSPVKIVDLARNMIRFAGLEEGKDIEIEFTGLRPGEKLYEELLMDNEKTIQTTNSDIMVSVGDAVEHQQVLQELTKLEEALEGDDDKIVSTLEQAVPTFTRQEMRVWN